VFPKAAERQPFVLTENSFNWQEMDAQQAEYGRNEKF